MKCENQHPVKLLRERLGLSQEQMAKAIGFKRGSTISNYENGFRKVEIETAYKMVLLANEKDKSTLTTLEHIYPPDMYTSCFREH